MKHFFVKHSIFCSYILCLAYVLLMLTTEISLSYPLMNEDANFYIQLTQDALNHGFPDAFNKLPAEVKQFPPLLNIGMTMLAAYTPCSVEWAGVLLCNAARLIAACGVFFLCRQIYSRLDLALVSSLLCLSLPGWYRYSYGILRDPLFWMTTIWFFCLILQSKQGKLSGAKYRLCIFAIGFLGGLMLLTRKEAILFLIPGIFWFCTPVNENSAGRTKFRWLKSIAGGLFLALFSLAVALIPKMAGVDFLPWSSYRPMLEIFSKWIV